MDDTGTGRLFEEGECY